MSLCLSVYVCPGIVLFCVPNIYIYQLLLIPIHRVINWRSLALTCCAYICVLLAWILMAWHTHTHHKMLVAREPEQERPYVMLNHGKNYTGNNRFYGFSMDLLDEIARISKFSYIVDINPDGAYGVKHPVTGEWNGVVKQLMSHVSHSTNHPIIIIFYSASWIN